MKTIDQAIKQNIKIQDELIKLRGILEDIKEGQRKKKMYKYKKK